MPKSIASRITNPIALIATLVGGLTTNCDGCGDVDVTAPPAPRVHAPGRSQSVAGCAEPERFRAYDTLTSPEQCDGTNNGGLELRLSPGNLGTCPDSKSLRTNEHFQVYWTLCNTAANPPPVVTTYQLKISSVANAQESDFRQFTFTQPALAPCDCTTVSVVFNSTTDPDPAKKLGVGSYRFRLTAPYTNSQAEQVDLIP